MWHLLEHQMKTTEKRLARLSPSGGGRGGGVLALRTRPLARVFVVLVVLIVMLALTGEGEGSETVPRPLPPSKRFEVFSLLLDREAKIRNLFISYVWTETGMDRPPTQTKIEWAMCGEKRYRKSWWSTPVGEPLPERWSTAVWNGKLLKAYDSGTDNGSVRAEFDPLNQIEDTPHTWENYGHMLGSPQRGSLGHLIAATPEEKWLMEWADADTRQSVILSTQTLKGKYTEGKRYEWIVDIEKGGMITAATVYIHPPASIPTDDKWFEFVHYTATESREVKPGLWFATKADGSLRYNDEAGALVVINDHTEINDIQVNQPEEAIRNLFEFEFPKGSMYYDFVLDSSMVAGMRDRSDVVKEIEAKVFELRDHLPPPPSIGSENTLAPETPVARHPEPGRGGSMWLLAAGVFAALALTILGWRLWSRNRKV